MRSNKDIAIIISAIKTADRYCYLTTQYILDKFAYPISCNYNTISELILYSRHIILDKIEEYINSLTDIQILIDSIRGAYSLYKCRVLSQVLLEMLGEEVDSNTTILELLCRLIPIDTDNWQLVIDHLNTVPDKYIGEWSNILEQSLENLSDNLLEQISKYYMIHGNIPDEYMKLICILYI